MGTTELQIPVVVGWRPTTRTAWAIPSDFRPAYGHYRSDRPHDRECEDAPHGPHTGRTGVPPTAAMIPSHITDPRPSPPGPRALPHESARGNYCQEIWRIYQVGV